MNRLLIPLFILLGSLLFCWHWNCNRAGNCGFEGSTHTYDIALDSVAVSTNLNLADSVASVTDTTAVVVTEEEKLLLEPHEVYFETSKSGIKRNADLDQWLTKAKLYLEKNPDKNFTLTGYTDSDGADADNIVLSAKRAETVKSILVKDGFKPDNLLTEGKGETDPIASNDSPDGKAKNRRVSIKLKN